MHVDVFTVQSSVIICRCRRPFDLYCLAATPAAVSEFSPESLDRDKRIKSNLFRSQVRHRHSTIVHRTFAVCVSVCVCYQKVTDATVAAVSANCLELTTLCLSKCDSITDEALTMLSQGCAMLTLVYTCVFLVCI